MSRGFPSALAIAVGLLAAPASLAEIVNRIIATVDGEPITAHEVQRYREASGPEPVSEDQALDAIITDKLLDREVRDKGIVVKSEEIDKYLEQVKERNRIDDYRFEAALEAQGLTLARYRERIKSELERSQLVSREIRGRVSVTPEEIERYYAAHRDEFIAGERVTLRTIVFRVEPLDRDEEVERIRAKAEEVRQLALTGRSFEELAKQFSEANGPDKSGRPTTQARGEMDPAVEAVVFTLTPGRPGDPVRTKRGFEIVLVDRIEPAGYRPLDEVRDQVREVLYQRAIEQRFQDWIAKDLRERHKVEVFN